MTRERILVAMSGGVDSAAAAAFLVEVGHEVVGATLKLWCYGGAEASPRSCCSLRDIEDAREAASTLGIRHYVLDEEGAFDEAVVRPFVNSYLAGETPNPCVRCNTHLKFGALLDRAGTLGFDAVATGHYALRENTPEGPMLRRARDRSKDQSYVLWGLTPGDLARARFPLGSYTKSEVRAAARRAGLRVSEKVESQDICFVPGGGYGEFVTARAAGALQTRPGDLVDTEGRVRGVHKGAVHYTVGQRRGLGVAAGEPLYVVRVEPDTNRVVVGREADLYAEGFTVREVNWISGPPNTGPPNTDPPNTDSLNTCSIEVEVKVRYRAVPTPAIVEILPGGRARIGLREPVRALAPGQSAVFYRGDVLLGGGIIESSPPPMNRFSG